MKEPGSGPLILVGLGSALGLGLMLGAWAASPSPNEVLIQCPGQYAEVCYDYFVEGDQDD